MSVVALKARESGETREPPDDELGLRSVRCDVLPRLDGRHEGPPGRLRTQLRQDLRQGGIPLTKASRNTWPEQAGGGYPWTLDQFECRFASAVTPAAPTWCSCGAVRVSPSEVRRGQGGGRCGQSSKCAGCGRQTSADSGHDLSGDAHTVADAGSGRCGGSPARRRAQRRRPAAGARLRQLRDGVDVAAEAVTRDLTAGSGSRQRHDMRSERVLTSRCGHSGEASSRAGRINGSASRRVGERRLQVGGSRQSNGGQISTIYFACRLSREGTLI